jgi:DNA-binding Lrp family transcriptional regulator
MNTPLQKNLTDLQMRLLDAYQRDFPMTPTPFADIADELAVDERTVIDTLKELQRSGHISRVGPVIRPHSVGVSTLVAMSVPETRLQEVATLVNDFTEVNHNYRREHDFNLWFVVTAADQRALKQVLENIENQTGLSCMSLPMLEDYFIDLGFPLQ